MATLYITEYAAAGCFAGESIAIAASRPIANNNVAIGGTHAESNAFNANTRFIRIEADAICSFVIGATPVATTADARIAANQTEYYQVNPTDKVSVITNT